MPDIEENELIVRIEWNENIHVDENRKRVDELFKELDGRSLEQTASVGRQDFILNRERELSSSEAELYFRTETSGEIAPLEQEIYRRLKERYPLSVISFSPPETVFEKLFVTGEPDIVAEFYARNRAQAPVAETIRKVEHELAVETGINPTGIAFENQLNLSISKEKLLLYRVSYNELYRVLKTAFRENSVTMLHSYQQYLPINIAGNEKTVNRVLQETLIQTQPDNKGNIEYIPLRELVKVTPAEDLKSITAGRNGEFVPFDFYGVRDADRLIKDVKQVAGNTGEWDTGFSGSFFSNREMLDELVVILLISLLLMYFILAAQFESFLQPLLVLAEIPIDVAFALLLLWICGHTLNLMSAIGLIVTCGIVINDSILKLDAINELRKAGVPLLEAIHEAGRRRLPSHYHDLADYGFRHGSALVLFGYGFGTAKAVVHCHDRDDVDRHGGEPVHHTVALLVHLPEKRRRQESGRKQTDDNNRLNENKLSYEETIYSFYSGGNVGRMSLPAVRTETPGTGLESDDCPGQRQFAGIIPHTEYVSFRLLGIPDIQGEPPAQPDAGPYSGTI